MDLRKLKKLIELVEESGIGELEITEGEEKVRISKSGSIVQSYVNSPATLQAAHVVPLTATQETETAAKETLPEGHMVKSPMVGTFTVHPHQVAMHL